MDEPTSSLDELSQFRMMEYMRDLMPDTMVIHAGHRPGIERFHGREIHLVRETGKGPATIQEPTLTQVLVHRLRRLVSPGA
jgi:putative ATP-binding cassette transporter